MAWTGGTGELSWLDHPFLATGGQSAPGWPRAPTSLIAPTSSPETNPCFSALVPVPPPSGSAPHWAVTSVSTPPPNPRSEK